MQTEKYLASADHLKSNRTRGCTAAGAIAVALITGVSAHAAVLQEVDHWILGSQNSGGADFNVSVVPGSDGFGGSTGASGAVNQPFNDIVTSYSFFNRVDDNTVGVYAQGGADVISVPTTPTTVNNPFGGARYLDLWETTSPGADMSAPSSTPDFGSGTEHTMASSQIFNGTIDISGRKSGGLYFFYGSYRAQSRFELTMSGAGQDDIVLSGFGDDDFSNNWETYGAAAIFETDLAYDTITYQYQIFNGDGSPKTVDGNGRLGGIVLTGSAFYAPEPSTSALAFLGLAAISAFRKKRMSIN